MNKAGQSLVALVIGGFICAIVAFISWTLYFAWDRQLEGANYKLLFEKEGKLYESSISSNVVAFDAASNEIFLNQCNSLDEFIAYSESDYTVSAVPNPYVAGRASTNAVKYAESKETFLNARESKRVTTFRDRKGTELFSCTPEDARAQPFLLELRPSFPAFSKRRYSISSKQLYINATRVLADKLKRQLRFRVDEELKLIIFRFE